MIIDGAPNRQLITVLVKSLAHGFQEFSVTPVVPVAGVIYYLFISFFLHFFLSWPKGLTYGFLTKFWCLELSVKKAAQHQNFVRNGFLAFR